MRKSSLKIRREMARRKRHTTKTFNLKWVNDTIDQIVTELSEYSEREPEIAAALETMLAAKRLVQAYSQRMFDTPYRSYKMSESEQRSSLVNMLMQRISRIYPMIMEAKDEIQIALDEADEWSGEGAIAEEVNDSIIDIGMAMNTLIETIADTSEDLKASRDELVMEKAIRSRYEGYYDNYGFDDASSIYQSQVDKRRDAELEAEYERIEAETEASTGLCRDDEGQFIDC